MIWSPADVVHLPTDKEIISRAKYRVWYVLGTNQIARLD